MKSWPHSLLTETTLYWKPPESNATGDFEWDYPFEIKCRWEYKNEVTISHIGDEVSSRAIVYASDLILSDGYMWKGSLIDVANDFKPPIDISSYSEVSKMAFESNKDDYVSQYSFALRVVKVNRISPLSNRKNFLYKVYLN